MKLSHVLKKEERISSRKEIDLLFREGKSFVVYPFRIIYLYRKPVSEVAASILISVPKKRFKRAVKRNRIKRLIKESYRLNKNEFVYFLKQQNESLLIAFLYISDNLPSYSDVDSAMKKSINLLKNKLS